MVAMEHVGVEVVAVRPYDCAKFGIYVHLTEVGGVLQWLGHRSPKITGEIDLADEVIGKGQRSRNPSSASTAVMRASRRLSFMAAAPLRRSRRAPLP